MCSLFIALLLDVASVGAQDLPFESLTVEDGLSQGMIFDILQTRDGFLWIATKDGLNRYDGFEYKVFTNDPFDPWSLSENTVITLFEDSQGRLWAGTQNSGLNLYDARTQRFQHFQYKTGQTKGLANNSVTSVAEDPSGAIWVVSRNQFLSCLRLPQTLPRQADLTEAVTWRENLSALDVTSRQEQRKMSCMRLLKDGRLLAGNRDGLYEIDWQKGTLQTIALPRTPSTAQGVFGILEDKNGVLWLGRDGAITLVRGQEVIHRPITDQPEAVIELASDPNGQIWASSSLFLWQINPEDAYEKPLLDLAPKSIPQGFWITALIADRTGILWCGTNGYGVRKFSPRMYDFSNYVPGKGIWSVFSDRQSRVWIKVFFDYFLLDRATGALTMPPFLRKSSDLQRSLIQDRQGRFWLLAKAKNHSPLNRLTGFSADFQTLSSVEFEAGFSLESRLYEDRAGDLWMGGTQGLLMRYSPATQTITRFGYGRLFPSTVREELETTTVVEDADGTFWIGTKHGLVKAVPEADSLRFSLFTNDPNDHQSLAHNFVLSILPGPGVSPWVWIGTKGGLGRLDKTTGHFRFFTKKDGLPDNVVYGVLADRDDRADAVWISTNRGLTRISGAGAGGPVVIRNYGIENGLPGMEFNTGAYARSESGELLFGGVNGLTVFHPQHLTVNGLAPKIQITGIGVNNREVAVGDSTGILLQAPEVTETLSLNWDENLLSIRFAALDFTAPGQNRYRYRLVGVDRDWVEAGTNNTAKYAHLSPGTYRFEVLAGNSDGVWNTEPVRLTLVVHPPWWRSWAAYLAYGLLLAWAAWAFYRTKIRRIRLENQLLFEKKEAERLAEMDEVKTRFFNNVTHEFRTPLTLILEPLRQVLPLIREPEVFEKVQFAEKSSRQLLHLVNQLLDMSKLAGGKMELDLRKDDIGETVRSVFQTFLPLAARKNIRLDFVAPEKLPAFFFDRKKIELIVNNLLSNAVKFTPEGGAIQVRLQTAAARPSGGLLLQVADTGIGIPAAVAHRVFERFYQVDNSSTRQVEGTGIGLSLTKELVELMGGQITLESPNPDADGKGSVFSVQIPMPDAGNTFSPAPRSGPAFSDPEALAPAGQKIGSARRERSATARTQLVLVIEDNADLRHFIKQSLPAPYQVVEAGNGAEGVRQALKWVPDLVISDVMMPEKDGLQVCDELKNNEITAHIPIILLTAKTGIDHKLRGLRTGADDYLTKPFNTEELLARVENLIETRRRLREKFGNSPLIGLAQPDGGEPSAAMSRIDHEFLRKFTTLLDEHLEDERLGVEDFARLMFISRMQLHRKLKALTDQSATEFIRNYRLDRAMELLRKKEGNVMQIAFRVGFGNEKYFSTTFKERFGASPSEV